MADGSADVGQASKANATPQKAPRELSSIEFPYVDLDGAVAVGAAIFKNGGFPCSREQLAAAMGQAPGSGNTSIKLGAARMFGLIESVQGKYQLTELGFSIVDSDETRVRAAKAQAFLKVALYRRVYEEYRGRQLPPRLGLEQAFVQFGVAVKQKDKARHAFERSAQQAGFFPEGKQDRLVEPIIGASTTLERVKPSADAAKDKERVSVRQFAAVNVDDFDPLLQGLLSRLPKPGDTWEHEKRLQWLRTLAANLYMVYPADQGGKFVSVEETKI